MNDTFHWLDVQRIGEELADRADNVDPKSISFTELRRLVTELPGFHEEPGHPVNERILEAIQAAWIDELEGVDHDDD